MAGPQDGRQLNLGVQFPCPWKPFPDAAGSDERTFRVEGLSAESEVEGTSTTCQL